MKGLEKMTYAQKPSTFEKDCVWQGSSGKSLRRCACRTFTLGRLVNLKTRKKTPLCAGCAGRRGYAEAVR